MPVTYKSIFVAIALLSLALACDFSPTAPFEGFDGMGSRLSGTFRSTGGVGSALTTAPQTLYDGITVYVEQDPSTSTDVKSNGTFTLVGLPQGTIAIVFERDGEVIGRIVFQDVVPNQELRIVVELTASGNVELVSVDRDNVGLGECARGPGFWCQNRTGTNPNMTREEFEQYAEGALERLRAEGVADMDDEIGYVEAAVCDTGNQLLRHLTTMLLNLEAELVEEGTPLIGEDYPDVDALVEAALNALTNDLPRSGTNAIKDALDRANNNVNTDSTCEPTEDDDPDDPDDPFQIPPECQPFVTGKKVTICHKGRNTLSISINALPAHLAHGDTCGPCN